MTSSPKFPRLIQRLTKEIPSNHDNSYNLGQKITWLALVDHGIRPCDPHTISDKLQELTKLDEYQPKGEKLLCLRSRDKFTLLPSMKPGRPEEALERLIVHSNPEALFGQMPIRGGKESVDIVRLKNKVGTLIELKPWRSSNSPLYAILEGLKNLTYFNLLKNMGHHRCENFEHVNLMVLAPVDYYRSYHLISEHGRLNIHPHVKEYVKAVASHFQTRIQFSGLNWKEAELLNVCKEICPTPPKENVTISVSEYPRVEALLEKNWIKII